MTPEQLYDSIPTQFWNRLSGWKENEQRKEREAWERQRTHIYYMVSMLSKSESPQKLLPFPWDKEDVKAKPKTLTPEQLAKLAKWDKVKPGQGKQASINPLLKNLK